mgnify:CR=1 FL=1
MTEPIRLNGDLSDMMKKGLDLGGPLQEALRQFGRHMTEKQGAAFICIGLQADGQVHVQSYVPGGIGQIAQLMWLGNVVLESSVEVKR